MAQWQELGGSTTATVDPDQSRLKAGQARLRYKVEYRRKRTGGRIRRVPYRIKFRIFNDSYQDSGRRAYATVTPHGSGQSPQRYKTKARFSKLRHVSLDRARKVDLMVAPGDTRGPFDDAARKRTITL